ncbi:MAG TPA: hypothetical protein VN493_19505 [Thermoanaerobaculia bacterium]|nr:hypothetical protein [Thermoanaerobaculia bacterium]
MRPTSKMLALVGGGESAPAPAPDTSDKAGLVARKAAVERALSETREELKGGQILATVREELRGFLEAPLAPPPTGAPDTLAVRVLGARGGQAKTQAKPRVPLPGLTLELRAGEEIIARAISGLGGGAAQGSIPDEIKGLFEKIVAQATTDLLGAAVIAFPESVKGAFEVNVLGPDSKVLATHRGRRTKGKAHTALIEVGYSTALAPAFDKGETWLAAGRVAEERAAEMEKKIAKALQNQEKALAVAVAELDEAINRC